MGLRPDYGKRLQFGLMCEKGRSKGDKKREKKRHKGVLRMDSDHVQEYLGSLNLEELDQLTGIMNRVSERDHPNIDRLDWIWKYTLVDKFFNRRFEEGHPSKFQGCDDIPPFDIDDKFNAS